MNRPRLTHKVARGLQSVISLVRVEFEAGSASEWISTLDAQENADATRALLYLIDLVEWKSKKPLP